MISTATSGVKGYEDGILKDSGLVTIDERRGGYDKFWNRAMFPIMDANSKVIAFGGRVMGEGEPKYLNSPETPVFNKSRTLYGLHLARKTRRPQMILCEGYMDVIALHQAGFDNAVASLGTALHPRDTPVILRRYTKEVLPELRQRRGRAEGGAAGDTDPPGRGDYLQGHQHVAPQGPGRVHQGAGAGGLRGADRPGGEQLHVHPADAGERF